LKDHNPGWLRHKRDTLFKIIQQKGLGGVAQMVEDLPGKHKALSSKNLIEMRLESC
jgi:hypothetical protein